MLRLNCVLIVDFNGDLIETYLVKNDQYYYHATYTDLNSYFPIYNIFSIWRQLSIWSWLRLKMFTHSSCSLLLMCFYLSALIRPMGKLMHTHTRAYTPAISPQQLWAQFKWITLVSQHSNFLPCPKYVQSGISLSICLHIAHNFMK